jgi:endonuclease I
MGLSFLEGLPPQHQARPPHVLGYRTARKVFLQFHKRRPHPLWPTPEPEAARTIEHVVPQRVYRDDPSRRMRCDMHNFFVFDARLNAAKSDLGYAGNAVFLQLAAEAGQRRQQRQQRRMQVIRPDGSRAGLLEWEEGQETTDPGDGHPGGTLYDPHHRILFAAADADDAAPDPQDQKWVLPPPALRGMIARTVAYMAAAYPAYAPAILGQRRVLDPSTLWAWHRTFPVCKYEYDRNMFVAFVQGNENVFVKYPEAVEEYLGGL